MRRLLHERSDSAERSARRCVPVGFGPVFRRRARCSGSTWHLRAPNYPEARAIAELGVYPHLFHALLRRGVAMAPGAYEILFLSMAHTDAMLEEIVELAGEAATEVAASLR
jgi:glutamate-1-semialdehyde aminotransferase